VAFGSADDEDRKEDDADPGVDHRDHRDGVGPESVGAFAVPRQRQEHQRADPPANACKDCGSSRDRRGPPPEILSKRHDDHRVGHDKPDGEHESHPDIGYKHVSRVDETEQDHPDAWDILSEGVEDQDRDGED